MEFSSEKLPMFWSDGNSPLMDMSGETYDGSGEFLDTPVPVRYTNPPSSALDRGETKVIGRENKPYQSFLADLFNLPDYDPKTYGQEPGSSHLHTHNPALSPGCLFILRASPLSTVDAMDKNWLLGDAEVEQLSMNLMRMSSGYMLGPQALAIPSTSLEPAAQNNGLPPAMAQPGLAYPKVAVPLSANSGSLFDLESNKQFMSPYPLSVFEAGGAPYIPNGHPASFRQHKYHNGEWEWNTMAIPPIETPVFRQLGGHPPGYQHTLGHVSAPGPHETVPLPWHHTAQSPGPISAPVSALPFSSLWSPWSMPSSWSLLPPAIPSSQPAIPSPRPAVPSPQPAVPSPQPAVPSPQPAIPSPQPAVPSSQPEIPPSGTPGPSEYVTHPDGKCNYIWPNDDRCQKPGGVRHWATTHALREARAIRTGRLALRQAKIVDSQAALELVEAYLPQCLQPGCGEAVYSSRWDSLLRHLEGQHAMAREEAQDTIAIWQARPDVSVGWEKLVRSIQDLKGSGDGGSADGQGSAE